MNKLGDGRVPLLIGLSALTMVASLYLIFVYAPTERVMGIVQRIFYFHVPSAWVGFLAFLVAFVAGVAYLGQRNLYWDMIEASSIEIGVLFSTVALVTGSIWARPIWNTWWTWDPRLTTTLVMWLYYVASLMLRQLVDDESRRGRFGAILSIVGFVNVPVVFLAIRLWRTIHPALFSSTGFAIEPSMMLTFGVSLTAFTLLYFCLLVTRVRVEYLSNEISKLKQLRGHTGLRP